MPVMFYKPYNPPLWLRRPMLQSVLASSRLRTMGKNPMANAATEVIVDAGDGVRLRGMVSRQETAAPRGTVLLLHGWEGSHRSAYMLSAGRIFFNDGWDVVRMNLRDHGDSHGLNRGLFLGTLIDESHRAVQAVAAAHARGPLFLMGFSMGANFALRMARRCREEPVHGLCHVVCVNPPLDPYAATRAIDRVPLLRRYFLKKWKRSLALKQKLFPGDYDFSDVLALNSCMAVTDALIERYTDYAGAGDYFGRYTLAEGYLDRVAVPVTVIMAEDDPIIDAGLLKAAAVNEMVDRIFHRYGGHCGYIEGAGLRAWHEEFCLSLFRRLAAA